jgi:hypothetical protein
MCHSNGQAISCGIVVTWSAVDFLLFDTNKMGGGMSEYGPFGLNDRFIIVTNCRENGDWQTNPAPLYCIPSILLLVMPLMFLQLFSSPCPSLVCLHDFMMSVSADTG